MAGRTQSYRHIYTLFVVGLGWVLFRGNGLSGALVWLKRMFLFTAANGVVSPSVYFDNRFIAVLIAAVLLCGPLQTVTGLKEKLFDDKKTYAYELPLLMVVMIMCICLLVGNTYNPFIYFQF